MIAVNKSIRETKKRMYISFILFLSLSAVPFISFDKNTQASSTMIRNVITKIKINRSLPPLLSRLIFYCFAY